MQYFHLNNQIFQKDGIAMANLRLPPHYPTSQVVITYQAGATVIIDYESKESAEKDFKKVIKWLRAK